MCIWDEVCLEIKLQGKKKFLNKDQLFILVYHWCYLNPIKTSGFWMGLSGYDICKNPWEPVYYIRRIGTYNTKNYLCTHKKYKKFQFHGGQQLPCSPFALLFIMVCLLWHQLMCSSSFCGIVVLLLELLFYLRYNITLKL